MRITFVGLGWEQLGIGLLSALAKGEGHKVDLAFSSALFNDRYNFNISALAALLNDKKDVLSAIKKQRPDVIAFSPITSTYQWMLDIAKESKSIFPDIKVIFGGVHASILQEKVLLNDHIDYVCIGEGDAAFIEILRSIERKSCHKPIVNTLYRPQSHENIIRGTQQAFIQDLDSLPIFDKVIWEDHMRLSDIYFTMASRGCPFHCTYCFNSFFATLSDCKPGNYVRHRSVEHVIYELKIAKARYSPKIIEFEDDVFTINKKWLKDFLYHYKKEINIPFQCLSHPTCMDEDIVIWLKEGGCSHVQLGIQSMDENYKKTVIKRYDKNIHVERALISMQKHGILPKVDHMFGLPNEPLSAQETARELYAKYYQYHIVKFVLTKLNIKIPGATKILDPKSFDLNFRKPVKSGSIIKTRPRTAPTIPGIEVLK